VVWLLGSTANLQKMLVAQPKLLLKSEQQIRDDGAQVIMVVCDMLGWDVVCASDRREGITCSTSTNGMDIAMLFLCRLFGQKAVMRSA
jgi:hypothetical protein